MWIMTDVGFISIVKHNKIPDTLVVRARVKADLKALFPGHAVETLPGADYLYRATIPTQAVAEALFYKVIGIDYESHSKDVAIARSAPAEHGTRSHAMYDTWSAFADLQELAPYSKVARPAPRFYSAPGKGTLIPPSIYGRTGLAKTAAGSAATFTAAKPFYAGGYGVTATPTAAKPYAPDKDGVPDYTGQKDWTAQTWGVEPTDAELDRILDADAALSDAELDALDDEQFLVQMRLREQHRIEDEEVDGMDPVNAIDLRGGLDDDLTPAESKRARRNRKARERRRAGKDEGLASAV